MGVAAGSDLHPSLPLSGAGGLRMRLGSCNSLTRTRLLGQQERGREKRRLSERSGIRVI